MNIQDVLWLSYKDLSERKVRTALTVLMVIIGVAAIVALTSQTAGISASIGQSLAALGPTTIILTPTKAAGFTVADTALLQSLPNVSSVIPAVTGTATLTAGTTNASATIVGISTAGLQALLGGNVSLYQGTEYQDSISPASLVGYSLAFPTSDAGRQAITAGEPATLTVGFGRTGAKVGVPVSGILNSYGSLIVPIDTSVIMSVQAAQLILHRSSYSVILVKATNTSSVVPLSNLITTIYGSNARIETTQQIIQTVATIIGSISLLLGVIAGISLLVAAIGIMNIMLMSVMERTHEIGIMKSIGFKSSDVLKVFMFQALLIGIIGGILGIALGAGASFGLSFILSHSSSPAANTTSNTSATHTTASAAPTARGGTGAARAGAGGGGAVLTSGGAGGPTSAGGASSSSASISYQPVVTVSSIISAMLVAVIVSLIAGIYPAWRASKMEPIDALRQL